MDDKKEFRGELSKILDMMGFSRFLGEAASEERQDMTLAEQTFQAKMAGGKDPNCLQGGLDHWC